MSDPIIETVSEAFNVSPQDINDQSGPGSVNGWDSVGHLDLVLAIEQRFKVSLTIDETTNLNNVGDIRLLLQKKGALP